MHGGLQKNDRRLKSGRYSTVTHKTLGDLIEFYKNDPDALNLFDELAFMRALTVDFVNRKGKKGLGASEIVDAAGLVDKIGRLVERIDAMRRSNAVSEAELNRVISAMARVVDVLVPDAELKVKIRAGWLAIVAR